MMGSLQLSEGHFVGKEGGEGALEHHDGHYDWEERQSVTNHPHQEQVHWYLRGRGVSNKIHFSSFQSYFSHNPRSVLVVLEQCPTTHGLF